VVLVAVEACLELATLNCTKPLKETEQDFFVTINVPLILKMRDVYFCGQTT
jgi:hypothetical protein